MRLLRASVLVAALVLAGTGTVWAQDEEVDPGVTDFNNGDYAGAMKVWQAKAAQSDPDAMTKLGNLYELGFAGKRDYSEAAKWYAKAAQLGFVLAQYDLANLYYDGRGVSRDIKQAARWYTAAAQGGHARAQFYLAQMYESGDGVERNEGTALQWYQKAADQGLPEAEYELGKKLIYGDGVAVDRVRGPDLLLKAAEQQYTKAQILIADCYWRGRVVEKNLIEAYVWASQAVMNTRLGPEADRARALLSNITSGMSGEQRKAAEIELEAVHPTKKKNGDAGSGDAGSGDAGSGGDGAGDTGAAPQ